MILFPSWLRCGAVGPFVISACVATGFSLAHAQVNCEAVPAGPARTDCYIGLGRIGGQNAAIAGSKARVESDRAALRKATGQSATGQRAKAKPPRKKSTQKSSAN